MMSQEDQFRRGGPTPQGMGYQPTAGAQPGILRSYFFCMPVSTQYMIIILCRVASAD